MGAAAGRPLAVPTPRENSDPEAEQTRPLPGSYVANRVSDKITPVCKNVSVCRSGSAADTQALTDYVKLFVAQHRCENRVAPLFATVHSLLTLPSPCSIELGEDPEVRTVGYLFNKLNYNNKNNLMAGLIVAG